MKKPISSPPQSRCRIDYEFSSDDPYYAKLTFMNSSVAVGEAAGNGDQTEWEIVDCFDGKRLDFRRVTDDHTQPADIWPSLMTKAHHLLLELHREAEAQAARDKRWAELYAEIQELREKIDGYTDQLADIRGVSDRSISMAMKTRNQMGAAYEALDDLEDSLDHDDHQE